jgi:hypothetical protein
MGASPPIGTEPILICLVLRRAIIARVQGFKDSRVQGFKGSRVQGFKGSRVQGFKGSRVQGFKEKIVIHEFK